MVDVARVNMFGMPVGTFRWDKRREVALFEYDHGFVGRGIEPSPLMMPVREGGRSTNYSLVKEGPHHRHGILINGL